MFALAVDVIQLCYGVEKMDRKQGRWCGGYAGLHTCSDFLYISPSQERNLNPVWGWQNVPLPFKTTIWKDTLWMQIQKRDIADKTADCKPY